VAAKAKKKAPAKKKAVAKKKPKLLSGGNPQIAKGYGEAPVKEYIAAMPGWKREIGAEIDAIATRAVPGVKKAVKWNSPFYGKIENSWFMCFLVFTRFVRVTFFQGASLKPPPVGASTYERVRYYDIYEGAFDAAQFEKSVKQSVKLPGEKL
jgi:hypothetical protein